MEFYVIKCKHCGTWRVVQTHSSLWKYVLACFTCNKSSKVFNRGESVLKFRKCRDNQEATFECQRLNGERTRKK